MKKIGLLQLLTIALIVLASACKEEPKKELPAQLETSAAVAKPASTPLYEDLEGKPVQLSDFMGKRVLLNYWATWCKPCIEEMPVLEGLQKKLATENYIFLFASDQSLKVIQKFQATKGFDLTFVKFNGTWADKGITALPVTLIYNEAGEQVERFDGVMDWDSPAMIQKLKDLH